VPSILQGIALFIAALLAGALNSVAGGGSFISFPTLILTGVPPIQANATNTVALWPGSLASVAAYRRELRSARHVALLSVMSVVGGVLGAYLLLHTPAATFSHLIPYLLLLATGLFAFSPAITRRLRGRAVHPNHSAPAPGPSRRTVGGIALLQFVTAVYGGFFGGGIGIIMLATLALIGMEDIHAMNGLKTVLATLINGVATLTFIIDRAVVWPQALVMLVGAVVGGYAGAAIARRLDPLLVRRFVIVVGVVMTIYFFVRRA
jgi:uncharacterized membrane protein YfcA